MEQTFLALDFGFTNSVMALGQDVDAQPQIVKSDSESDELLWPNLVYYGADRDLFSVSVQQLLNTADSEKTWNDINRCVYKNIKRDLARPNIARPFSKDRRISPLDCCTYLLRYFKEQAEACLKSGQSLQRVIMTYPTDYSDYPQQQLKEAALAAGFSQVVLVSEVEAVAHYYASSIAKTKRGLVVVNIGASQTEFAYLSHSDQQHFCLDKQIKPVIVRNFGGDYLDGCLYKAWNTASSADNQPLSSSPERVNSLAFMSCRQIKECLSKVQSLCLKSPEENVGVNFEVTPELYRNCTQEVFAKFTTELKQYVENIVQSGAPLEVAILIGSPALQPLVQEAVSSCLPQKTVFLANQVQSAAAFGAVEYGKQALTWSTEQPESLCQTGLSYRNSANAQYDLTKAVAYFQKAAAAGSAQGQRLLGNCCFDGEGLAADKAKALQYYEQAAAQGDPLATFLLVGCYALGYGSQTEPDKAKHLAEQLFKEMRQNVPSAFPQIFNAVLPLMGIKKSQATQSTPGDFVNCPVGSIIEFGKCVQGKNREKQSLKWVVLHRNNGSLWMMSQFAIAPIPYHDSDQKVKWSESKLRAFLNTVFIKAFRTEEIARLVPTAIFSNSSEEDRIFCLNNKMFQKFLGDKLRLAPATPYVVDKGLAAMNGCCKWWLAQAEADRVTPAVDESGQIVSLRVTDTTVLIRPVIRLKI